jgi:hypothetical protein
MNIRRQNVHPSHPKETSLGRKYHFSQMQHGKPTWKNQMIYAESSNVLLYLCEDGCETAHQAYFTTRTSKAKKEIPFVSNTALRHGERSSNTNILGGDTIFLPSREESNTF